MYRSPQVFGARWKNGPEKEESCDSSRDAAGSQSRHALFGSKKDAAEIGEKRSEALQESSPLAVRRRHNAMLAANGLVTAPLIAQTPQHIPACPVVLLDAHYFTFSKDEQPA